MSHVYTLYIVCYYCSGGHSIYTFLSKSLHFFLALSELKTDDLRLLLLRSNALAEPVADG